MTVIRLQPILARALTPILGLLLAGPVLAEGALPETQAVTSEVLVKSSTSWNGAALPDYPQGTPVISILRIGIPPGMQLPLHRHPVINAAYLLKGVLTVSAEDGKRIEIKAGEAIIEVVDTWHYGRNDGPEPVEILVFYAGTPGTPIAVKK